MWEVVVVKLVVMVCWWGLEAGGGWERLESLRHRIPEGRNLPGRRAEGGRRSIYATCGI